MFSGGIEKNQWHENISIPEVLLLFHGLKKETSGMKWVTSA